MNFPTARTMYRKFMALSAGLAMCKRAGQEPPAPEKLIQMARAQQEMLAQESDQLAADRDAELRRRLAMAEQRQRADLSQQLDFILGR